MSFPHGGAPDLPRTLAPVIEPRFKPCPECGHFPAYHDGSRRPLPWLGLAYCRAWVPENVDHKCRCTSCPIPAAVAS